MSPAVRERAEEKPDRRGRVWLLAAASLPAVMLLLLLAPLVHPVLFQFGPYVLAARGQHLEPADGGFAPQGFSSQHVDPPADGIGYVPDTGERFVTPDGMQLSCLIVGDWAYLVWWFRGHRTK